MKKIRFTLASDGFYGTYWECPQPSDCTILAALGDDPEDHMARATVKWLHTLGVHVLSLSPEKAASGYHNYPMESIEKAIAWLQAHGSRKIGIVGASTTGTLALTAAAYFPAITLTVAMTPSDFVWQGVTQGNQDGCKEWPVPGEALFAYHGQPLPCMPFVYQDKDYWHCIETEAKTTGNMLAARKLYDDSEAAHPIREEEFIPVEKIQGRLLLIGAEDDALWDTAKYIRRMQARLAQKPHTCQVEAAVYAHGTHFVFPEGMVKAILPVGSGLLVRAAFKAGKDYPKECKVTHLDIDRRVSAAVAAWKTED